MMEHKPYGIYEKYVKRPQDFLLALGAAVVLSPVILTTGVLVKTKLGSPVFFMQERPGRDGKIFKLYKFRTMIDAYDENGVPLIDELRITPFGQKLRSASLDELPELFNVLKGVSGEKNGSTPRLYRVGSDPRQERHDLGGAFRLGCEIRR